MAQEAADFRWHESTAVLFARLGGTIVVEIVGEPPAGESSDGAARLPGSSIWCRHAKNVYSLQVGCTDGQALPVPVETGNLTLFWEDPVEFLQGMDRPIDLLYLDAWAVGTAGYKERHLDAYRPAKAWLQDRSLVLIGQTGRDQGGKGSLVVAEALADGFNILLWGSLTLLGRIALADVRGMFPRVGPPVPGEASFEEAMQLHQQGFSWEAEQIYRRILEGQPSHTGALHLLGVARHQQGDHGTAEQLIGRAIALSPPKAVYFQNYGLALHGLGRHAEALKSFRRALEIRPQYVQALANLGMVQQSLGEHEAALASFRRALQIGPRHVDARIKLASLLEKLGRKQEAAELYVEGIRLEPCLEYHVNLGGLMIENGRADLAVESYRKAVESAPECAAVHFGLGCALQEAQRVDEARVYFLPAARLSPEKPFWQFRALACAPAVFQSSEEIGVYREQLFQATEAWRRMAPRAADWNGLVMAGVIPGFALSYHGRDSRRLKENFAALHEPYFRDQPRPAGSGLGDRHRIGFVLTRRHEGMFLRSMKGIVSRLDRNQFEPRVFCSGEAVKQIRQERLLDDVGVEPFGESMPEVVDRIRQAACDLIYYWEVGSDAMNYLLPFARLAPVQCTGWDSTITSGVPAVDYFLSSELIESPGSEVQYTERLWRSKTLFANTGRLPAVSPASPGHFGLPDDRRVYLCFQNPLKLHPDMDPLLAAILAADPRGLIVLYGRQPEVVRLLKERFARRIPQSAERILFLSPQSFENYCRLLQLADVILDTVHYGAGSSCYDLFSFNLPVVTWPGELIVGRMTQACYRKMAVDDLIVHSAEDYVSKAVQVANDGDYRKYVTKRIAQASDVLFDDLEAVREHERFFEEVISAPEHR